MKTEAIHKAPLLGGVGVGFGRTEDRRPKTEVKNRNSSNQQPATSNQQPATRILKI